MEEPTMESILENLIADVDKKLEETGEHEITRRLELRKKKAGYMMSLTGEVKYGFELLELYEQLEKRLSIFYTDN